MGLENKVREIINNFAFKNDSSEVPTAPTPQQQDFIRAMILLCHAEFEDYLEETANKYPDKIAFADIKNTITFSELVQNAKKLSVKISKYFSPGSAVPIMIEKSVKTVEYFFAALYSGCFYSYFDATFPDSRLNSMIQTLDAKYIIADSKYSKKFAELKIVLLIIVTTLFTAKGR